MSETGKRVRIGAGAGYSGDRIDPAVELCENGEIDYLVFECLAERTIAMAQLAKRRDPDSGFDPLLEERLEAVLPICAEKKICILSNMGAANPKAASKKACEVARRLGLRGLRVAYVVGDDVLELIQGEDWRDATHKAISANAYLGADALMEALGAGADVILTGRVADPSLFVAPLVHEFGWAMDDWARLGRGTMVGHLLECAGQLTGGYFADPGYKDVPGLARLGFPYADVDEDGNAEFGKVDGSGGLLTTATCTEQLLYEIEDPAAYVTPDVTADFSQVTLQQAGVNRVAARGARGRARPKTLKVSVGFHDGFVGEGQISYAGPGAVGRAELARDILAERLKRYGLDAMRFDLMGVDSILGCALSNAAVVSASNLSEVRLRAVGRASSFAMAARVGREVEALYTNGPAGGGGVWGWTRESVGIRAAYVARDLVKTQVHCEVA